MCVFSRWRCVRGDDARGFSASCGRARGESEEYLQREHHERGGGHGVVVVQLWTGGIDMFLHFDVATG